MEFCDEVGFERATKALYEVETGLAGWSELRPAERAAWRREMRRRADATDAWVGAQVGASET